jgi:putative transposase
VHFGCWNVLDDVTREGLDIGGDFSMPAERVIRILDRIIEWRGKRGAIQVDNRPEYISEKLNEWAEKHGIAIQHIQPGQPRQNACVERCNRMVRHEWLDQYIIESIEQAQDQAAQWLWIYNNDRPNISIGGITPAMKLKMAA